MVDIMPLDSLRMPYSARALKYSNDSTGEDWTQEIRPDRKYVEEEMSAGIEKMMADRRARQEADAAKAVDMLLAGLPPRSAAMEYAYGLVPKLQGEELAKYGRWLEGELDVIKDDAKFRDKLRRQGGFRETVIAQINEDDIKLLRDRFVDNIQVGKEALAANQQAEPGTADATTL